MKKRIFRILSGILSLVLIVTSLPLAAYATESSTSSDDTEPQTSGIVELKELRGASSKQYRLEDGSYYVAQYETNVHTLSEDGTWEEIDRTLPAKSSGISTTDEKIKFAKKITGNESLFTLHNGNTKMTLRLVGAQKKVEGIITNYSAEVDENATELQKMTTLSGLSAAVRYPDILPNTDLKYVIEGTDIKEYIIVKEKGEDYTYTFSLDLNNLVATKQETGEIWITKTGTDDLVYRIPAPVMWDSAGAYSTAAEMSLTEIGNGKYALIVTADSAWINDEARVFPVVIDPPIYSGQQSSIIDLYIDTWDEDLNMESDPYLLIFDHYYSYWKLRSLPSIPSSAYIVDATFQIKDIVFDSYSPGYVGVFDVISSWDKSLTWSKYQSGHGRLASNYTDFAYVECVKGSESLFQNWETFNVTPIVKKWYAGTNYGLALTEAEGSSLLGTVKCPSSNNTDTSGRPSLTITYRDMAGMEDYWSFTSQSAGFAGTGAINNATGNLVFSIPTITTTDALMPFTPTLVYNGAYAGTGNRSFFGMPVGFQMNFQETLCRVMRRNSVGDEKPWFIWTDGDGTEHYFQLKNSSQWSEGDSVEEYEDEDGLHLTLKREGNVCTIKDSEDTVRSFTQYPIRQGTVLCPESPPPPDCHGSLGDF